MLTDTCLPLISLHDHCNAYLCVLCSCLNLIMVNNEKNRERALLLHYYYYYTLAYYCNTPMILRSLIADKPFSCRTLLSATESWLSWSGMKANVPKCLSLAIHSSSSKPYNPELTMNEETIPYTGNSTFHFLGAPVSVHATSAQSIECLLLKLRSLLEKIDATLVKR